jgi:hypothetical protein
VLPSQTLKDVSAETVANSYLMHRPAERETCRIQLSEAIELDPSGGLSVLAGLRKAGLGYKDIGGDIKLNMRHPPLSNPSPGEFSTNLSAALSGPQDVAELLTESGREVYEAEAGSLPGGEQTMQQWLENMEIAVDKQGL